MTVWLTLLVLMTIAFPVFVKLLNGLAVVILDAVKNSKIRNKANKRLFVLKTILFSEFRLVFPPF